METNLRVAPTFCVKRTVEKRARDTHVEQPGDFSLKNSTAYSSCIEVMVFLASGTQQELLSLLEPPPSEPETLHASR